MPSATITLAMILPPYRIDASTLRDADKGLFLREDIEAGRIIAVPDAIERTYHLEKLMANRNYGYHTCPSQSIG